MASNLWLGSAKAASALLLAGAALAAGTQEPRQDQDAGRSAARREAVDPNPALSAAIGSMPSFASGGAATIEGRRARARWEMPGGVSCRADLEFRERIADGSAQPASGPSAEGGWRPLSVVCGPRSPAP